jgi:hypothetical protein
VSSYWFAYNKFPVLNVRALKALCSERSTQRWGSVAFSMAPPGGTSGTSTSSQNGVDDHETRTVQYSTVSSMSESHARLLAGDSWPRFQKVSVSTSTLPSAAGVSSCSAVPRKSEKLRVVVYIDCRFWVLKSEPFKRVALAHIACGHHVRFYSPLLPTSSCVGNSGFPHVDILACANAIQRWLS